MVLGLLRLFRPQKTFLLAGLLIAGFLVFFPAKALVGQRGQIDRLESRLDALQDGNAQLSHEVSRLSDPESLELEARERLGVARPGEQSYVISQTPEASNPPVKTETVKPGFWTNLWRGIVEFVKGDG